MLILDSTLKSIELILSGAVTTNQLPFVTSYIDVTSTTYVPNSNDGVSNNAVAVTTIAAPIASTQRQIKLITVHNADTVSATVTLRLNNNGTFRTICKVVLSTLSQLVYTDGEGFRVIDQNGGVVQGNNVISLTSQVSGILPVANGGTGVSALSDVLGTSNQITVTGGTARVIGGNVTLALPQNVHTGATPQFTRLGIGAVADANYLLNLDVGTAGTAIRLNRTTGSNSNYLSFLDGGTEKFRVGENILSQGIGKLVIAAIGPNVINMVFDPSGNAGIGVAPATSALLELSSTIGALLITRMTTTQRDALTAVNGMIIYNTTTAKFQGYEAGVWNNFSVL